MFFTLFPDEVSITKFVYPSIQKQSFLDPEVIKRVPSGYTQRRKEYNDNVKIEALLSGVISDITDIDVKKKILKAAEMVFSYMDSEDFRKRFPDGRMGSNPDLSKESDGKLLLDTAVKSAIADFKSFLECNSS